MDAVLNALLTNADHIGVAGFAILIVVGFIRGWIVPGPVHDREVKRADASVTAERDSTAVMRRLVRYLERLYPDPAGDLYDDISGGGRE